MPRFSLKLRTLLFLVALLALTLGGAAWWRRRTTVVEETRMFNPTGGIREVVVREYADGHVERVSVPR
jgi:hypothetical protein